MKNENYPLMWKTKSNCQNHGGEHVVWAIQSKVNIMVHPEKKQINSVPIWSGLSSSDRQEI